MMGIHYALDAVFEQKCFFIYRFEGARTENAVDFDSGTNDLMRQIIDP